MKNNKTDMLTPEQFNSMGLYSNCLGFAIGVPQKLVLEYREPYNDGGLGISNYKDMDIGESFKKRLSEYGMDVKEAKQLSDLKGKTGFIVYGFYPRKDYLGSIFYDDFHVVRVNSDGTAVHKPDDMSTPATKVELVNDKGGIHEYERTNEPIRLFTLVGEKNKDTNKIAKRKSKVLSALSNLLQSSSDGSPNNGELANQINEIKRVLDSSNHLNSSDINILLQRAKTILREHNIELEEDKEDRGVGE